MVGWIKNRSIEAKAPYESSVVLRKFLRKFRTSPLRLAFFDIDFTLSSNTELLPQIRKSLEKQGYATVFVTARTEEMVMSKKAYEQSIHGGFYRPRPYLLKKKDKYEYIDPKRLNRFLVDPDIIIGSTGTQILVKQTSGVYKKDTEFENKLTEDSRNWRRKIIKILKEIDPLQEHFSFSPVEDVTNYYMGKTDVFPPRLRVQLFFATYAHKKWFLKQLDKRKLLNTLTHRIPSSCIRVIDEVSEKTGTFSVYLTPTKGHKGNAVEHVVKQLVKAVKQKKHTFTKSQIETILAGDSYADLGMLLHGALGTKSTAILVGGSQVGQQLTAEDITQGMTDDILTLRSRLTPTKKRGYFSYKVPADLSANEVSRTLIIGDSAYPDTRGSETILAHLSKITRKVEHGSMLFSRLHKAVSSIRGYLPVPVFER